jgi:beta-phosphoglucomutase-like phosphatase (HAD superfamily)
MLQEMMNKLEVQRREDPESVPENAEGIIKSTLKQEMDTEIDRAREELSLERFEEYGSQQRYYVDEKDISGPIDDGVQRLIEESEAEYSHNMASRLEMEDFLRYEAEAFRTAAENVQQESSLVGPEGNPDAWALERLQDMASSRQDVEGGEVVLDILDDVTEDLVNRMEKERAKQGAVKTETMKEWQMFRSIATQLGKQEGETTREGGTVTDASRNKEIVRRLDSWKDYVVKEQKIRDDGGLSQTMKKDVDDATTGTVKSDRKSRAEFRKKINKMSIEALESLMVSSDPARRDNLQRELDFLRTELEGKDYLDFEEPEEEEDLAIGPVDMSNMFKSTEKETPKKVVPNVPDGVAVGSVTDPPPNTAFFSDTEMDNDRNDPPSPKSPTPSTPFFTDTVSSDSDPSDYSKLGSLEEQKLTSLYRRAGARTREEQEKIRAGWEDYQRVEKEQRKLSGLDDSSESQDDYDLTSKFNVSAVVNEDGDFDANEILSAIGPRPKRSKLVKEEIASSLYRSVSAVGGDRYKDDPGAKAKDQAEYVSFLEKETEMRQSLDRSSEETPVEEPTPDQNFDDLEYAKSALASLAPRPDRKSSRGVDPREYSDMGGVLAAEDAGDDEDDDDDDDDSGFQENAYEEENVETPEWLKRETKEGQKPSRRRKTFLGEEVEDAFDDDQYEKNMRQLAEYERRRSGKQQQMGIDISDVLGRRDVDDYKDYKFDEGMYPGGRSGWGVASFDDRKRNLVEYTQLDITEVNSLMDHKESVSTTGVSQYTKRINKPFEAFGAIFRLEGVFADLSGMHEQVWTKVAIAENLRLPSLDEVRRAAVVHPESAIQEVFVWTDDFMESSRLAKVFRETFRKVFNSWAKANDLVTNVEKPAAPVQGNLAMGGELFEDTAPSASGLSLPTDEGELLQLLARTWTEVATKRGKALPTNEDIQQAALVSPDLAIREVFKWGTDANEIKDIEGDFQSLIRSLSGNAPQTKEQSRPTGGDPRGSTVVSKETVMEAHYAAWLQVAEQFGFEKPTTDEVLGAFVLNDPMIVARDGFGWTADTSVLSQVVDQFSKEVEVAIRERSGPQATIQPPVRTEEANTPEVVKAPQSTGKAPTFEEVMGMNKRAWEAAASTLGFGPPGEEIVRVSLDMEPGDVVTRLLKWSQDPYVVARVVYTFQEELKRESDDSASNYNLVMDQKTDSTKGRADATPTVSSDDLYTAAMNAWSATAEVHSLNSPTSDEVVFAMSVGPEEAIAVGFGWTKDKDESETIQKTYMIKLKRERKRLKLDKLSASVEPVKAVELPLVSVIPGSIPWVNSLKEYEMKCGVISHLDSDQVAALLKFAQLDVLFGPDVRVSANSGYKGDSQQMLGAALRVERRPDHCVIFDASPYSSVAAHELDIRSVGLIGSYPRYELLSADTTASGFAELTAFNIRRLFGERIYDQPEMDQQMADPILAKKRKTMYDWGDDP